jgi:trimeric autotransporter adhesin
MKVIYGFNRKSIVLILMLLAALDLTAQNVGLNATGSAANASAALDIDVSGLATKRGLLIPRVTNADKTAMNPLPAAAQGLVVYQTDGVQGFYYNTSITTTPNWVYLAAGANNAWSLTGNAGTVAGTNFLGTTDNVDLQFKVNNSLAGLINISNLNTLFGIGVGAGTGSHNSAFGFHTLNPSNTGNGNAAFGWNVLDINTSGGYNTGMGWQALAYNSTGGSNAAFGVAALMFNTNGSNNVAVGSNALNANTQGFSNVAIGVSALSSNVAGTSATAIGGRAMLNSNNSSTIFTNYNVAIGFEALRGSTTPSANTGNFNTGTGYQVLQNYTSGAANNAYGYQSLFTNVDGFNNDAFGYQSLYSNTSGNSNDAFGWQALNKNTSGYSNTASGSQALYLNTVGFYNTAHGAGSLYSNTSGVDNTSVGANSLYSNSLGNYNSALGYGSLNKNTTASQNTAIGYMALFNQSYSNGGVVWDSYNVAVGDEALYSNQPTATTNGFENTALGRRALYTNTIGAYNTAIGFHALYSNVSGTYNNAFGTTALFNNTANYNAAFGDAALFSNTAGASNVAMGNSSLKNNTTGNYNTAIGEWAGLGNLTGTHNTFLGRFSQVSVDGLTNVTAIGAYATVSASNNIILGGTGTYAANVGIGVTAALDKLHVSDAASPNAATIRVSGLSSTSTLTTNTTDVMLMADNNGTIRRGNEAVKDAWYTTGNATTAVRKFGTTSNQSVDLISNNLVRGRLANTGQFFIGATAATYSTDFMEVVSTSTYPWALNGLSSYNGSGVYGTIRGANTTVYAGVQGENNSTTGTINSAGVRGINASVTAGTGFRSLAATGPRVGVVGTFTQIGSYSFGVHGTSASVSIRTGAVFGDDGGFAYGGLGYYASNGSDYGVYGFGSAYQTGVVGGKPGFGGTGNAPNGPSNNTSNSMIGLGIYGGVMGGWVRGMQYGLHARGERYSLYVDGLTFSNSPYTQLITKDDNTRVPAYSTSSLTADITIKGKGRLENGKAHISFDKNFSQVISNPEDIVITVTPSGNTNGVYISSVDADGFVVSENNNGSATVNFSWIAIATIKGSDKLQVAPELLNSDFDKKMNGVMFNDNNNSDNPQPIWWDGNQIRFDAPPVKKKDENVPSFLRKQ